MYCIAKDQAEAEWCQNCFDNLYEHHFGFALKPWGKHWQHIWPIRLDRGNKGKWVVGYDDLQASVVAVVRAAGQIAVACGDRNSQGVKVPLTRKEEQDFLKLCDQARELVKGVDFPELWGPYE